MLTMPAVFKEHYPHTHCIIDATELRIETPSDRAVQSAAYSSYKHHNTFKALFCISPSRAVIIVSHLFTGSISDPELTCRSGLLDKLEAGDQVMTDRGFTILDDLIARGAHLNFPVFMEGRAQLITSKVLLSCIIAIEGTKNYRILQQVIPLSYAYFADTIFSICASLVNFQPVLVS